MGKDCGWSDQGSQPEMYMEGTLSCVRRNILGFYGQASEFCRGVSLICVKAFYEVFERVPLCPKEDT